MAVDKVVNGSYQTLGCQIDNKTLLTKCLSDDCFADVLLRTDCAAVTVGLSRSDGRSPKMAVRISGAALMLGYLLSKYGTHERLSDTLQGIRAVFESSESSLETNP